MSITGADCAIDDSLLIHVGKVLHCFDEPSKIIIPSTVREIGRSAFSSMDSLEVLVFEEGVVRIGPEAFQGCSQLETVTFPASLEVIGEYAFLFCNSLRRLRFAAGSQLQSIHKNAFAFAPLQEVILPEKVKEIDPSAFNNAVWRLVQVDGPPIFAVNGDFLSSPDSRILLKLLSPVGTVAIPAVIEVIGPEAFSRSSWIVGIEFESGTRLNEIGVSAFADCNSLKSFIVPSSVETLGDRCFEKCSKLTRVTFETSSKLKRIGERAFAESVLTSITIRASTETVDGSAFVGCPLKAIEVSPGSETFKIEGHFIMKAFGERTAYPDISSPILIISFFRFSFFVFRSPFSASRL
jgi:hypothetical protein